MDFVARRDSQCPFSDLLEPSRAAAPVQAAAARAPLGGCSSPSPSSILRPMDPLGFDSFCETRDLEDAKVQVVSFRSGALLRVYDNGTLIVDRRAQFARARGVGLLGPQLLSTMRLSVTLSMQDPDTGALTLTTTLWRDMDLGVCESHTFCALAHMLCSTHRPW